jgi:phenylpyruvate tautomerase PptA (4-oxalocrotonate tautomerase family)
MPMIDFTYSEGALREGQPQQLAERFVPILAKWEGLPDHARLIANIWVLFHELKANAFTAGGHASLPSNPLYRIVITVPRGLLNEERKRGLVDELTRTLLELDSHPIFTEARPELSQGPLRVYCLVNEVPYEDWGYDGNMWTPRELGAFLLGPSPSQF